MNKDEAWRILDRYQVKNGWDAIQIATVISDLEDKVTTLQAQCESGVALLIGERGENAKLLAENHDMQYGKTAVRHTV